MVYEFFIWVMKWNPCSWHMGFSYWSCLMNLDEQIWGNIDWGLWFSDVKWRHVCQEPWWDRFWVLGEYQRQRLENSNQYLWEWKHEHRQRRKIWTLVWPIRGFSWIHHSLDSISHHVSVLKNHINEILVVHVLLKDFDVMSLYLVHYLEFLLLKRGNLVWFLDVFPLELRAPCFVKTIFLCSNRERAV